MLESRRLFIVGTQGIPARYGGLETFAHELAVRLAARGGDVWVTCELGPDDPVDAQQFEGVRLLYVRAPANNARTIVSDRRALKMCYERARPGDVVYLLGYGVGIFGSVVLRALRQKGVKFWLNPDGLEWKRPRWPWYARIYLRHSERHLLARADRIICDAAAIKTFHERESNMDPEKACVIEYGAPVVERPVDDVTAAARDQFLDDHALELGEYYCYVGRFVPDNNMEIMVQGVLETSIDRKLLVCASYNEDDPFFRRLSSLVEASDNPHRVVFAGGVYDRDLLTALRLGQFAYFHGHEVGGTNPALVEAMGLGSPTIALDTVFNREVLAENAVFFAKDISSFRTALHELERMTPVERAELGDRVRERVREYYNWERITDDYVRLLESPG